MGPPLAPPAPPRPPRPRHDPGASPSRGRHPDLVAGRGHGLRGGSGRRQPVRPDGPGGAVRPTSPGRRRTGLTGAAALLRYPRARPGVRGRVPALWRHTSCVAVAHDTDEVPTLILDAGTGLREVTSLLAGQPFAGTILLSHLHWDHVHGLPFFRGGGTLGAMVTPLVHEPSRDQ